MRVDDCAVRVRLNHWIHVVARVASSSLPLLDNPHQSRAFRTAQSEAATHRGRACLFGALPWTLACLSVLAGCRFLKSDERPVTGGKPYSDPELAQLLNPDRPVEHASLSTDSRGYRVYEALFRGAPPPDYKEHYLDLIRTRGVLIRPIGSSPHAIPPRVFGYSIIAILPGPEKPFTIRYAEFTTKDEDWLDEHPLFSAPDPVMLDDRTLTVRIGWERQAWTELILVPDTDVEKVQEFPFARYPSAVLKSVGPLDDYGLVTRQNVRRRYVVGCTSVSEILSHYENKLRSIGVENVQVTATSLLWNGTARGGIEAVGISKVPIDTISGSGLGLSELRKHVPRVFRGLP